MRTERVGFALCGSFCTHEKALTALKRLTEEYVTVIPIVSENAAFTDTRFGTSRRPAGSSGRTDGTGCTL